MKLTEVLTLFVGVIVILFVVAAIAIFPRFAIVGFSTASVSQADTDNPDVTVIDVFPGDVVNRKLQVHFLFTVSDASSEIEKCEVQTTEVLATINNPIEDEETEIVAELGPGKHIGALFCTDTAGNRGAEGFEVEISEEDVSAGADTGTGTTGQDEEPIPAEEQPFGEGLLQTFTPPPRAETGFSNFFIVLVSVLVVVGLAGTYYVLRRREKPPKPPKASAATARRAPAWQMAPAQQMQQFPQRPQQQVQQQPATADVKASLRQYIQNAVMSGYTADDVRNSLLQAGWQQSIVDEVLQEFFGFK